jgi:5-methylcytosine-specific restriction endonuclease McrA
VARRFTPVAPPSGPSPRQAGSEDFRCFNCDDPVDSPTDLFCTDLCRQMASAIRYARAVYADGRIKRPDVAEAVRSQIGMAVGGGYPEKARRLTEVDRQQIFNRDGGVCQKCGAPASEIDHIRPLVLDDINHPDNLQALCSACHRKKTLSGFRPIENDQQLRRAQEIHLRTYAPEPIRLCDAPDWAARWRGYRRERVKRAAESGARTVKL